MKNILILIGILISTSAMSQSYNVGKIDADGKITLSIEQNKGCSILNQMAMKKNFSAMVINEVSFTRLNRGQICLTGYEKDAFGKIINGIRIQCTQDDENNLIVISSNFSESISGKAFTDSAN